MSVSPVLECVAARKVFRTYRREKGLRGVLKNFFAREPVDIVALEGVDLVAQPGEFLGLIGPNGAGKTTLVKALVGIVPVSAGRASLFGRDSFHLRDEDKRRLSLVMGQRSQLWWDLPPIDSFRLLREIYQIPPEDFDRRVAAFSAMLDVEDRLTIQLRQLSLGQRMKMEIIGAFLHDPEVVFLDEPTIGLDLISRETIRRFLVELNQERGTTMILTSHDMEDIEDTCKRLVILDAGRVLFDGDLVQLHRRIVGRRQVEIHLAPGAAGWRTELAGDLVRFDAELVKETGSALVFLVDAERTQDLIVWIFERFDVRDLTVERQPLEGLIREVFETKELGG